MAEAFETARNPADQDEILAAVHRNQRKLDIYPHLVAFVKAVRDQINAGHPVAVKTRAEDLLKRIHDAEN